MGYGHDYKGSGQFKDNFMGGSMNESDPLSMNNTFGLLSPFQQFIDSFNNGTVSVAAAPSGGPSGNTPVTGTESAGPFGNQSTNLPTSELGGGAVNTGGTGGGFWSDPQNIIGAIGAGTSLVGAGTSGSGGGGVLGSQKGYFHDNPALPLGLQNLMDILSSQGRTDPKLLNRNLTANARDTEAQQQQQRGYAASRGVQNAGVTDAITAAIGAAGADRASGIHAQDAAVAEQRRRQDLQLLLDLIIKPGIDYSAIDAGQYNARQDADARRQGAYVSAAAEFANLFDWDKDEK